VLTDVSPTCFTARPQPRLWDYRESVKNTRLFWTYTIQETPFMARMHARRRGKSCSVRPYRKQAPAWSNTDAKAITKVILDLRKEGASGSRIGLILRDRYGVPDVKLALGKRIGDILRENKVASEIPEDLRDLMSKALGLRKHLGENKKDLHNKRQLQLIESKIRRLVKYYVGSKKLQKDFIYKPENAEILLSR
jgi:small subunit ribosomal protein S15